MAGTKTIVTLVLLHLDEYLPPGKLAKLTYLTERLRLALSTHCTAPRTLLEHSPDTVCRQPTLLSNGFLRRLSYHYRIPQDCQKAVASRNRRPCQPTLDTDVYKRSILITV